MSDLETTVIITPAIPLDDMTLLERLVLSHVFDAGETDNGLLLYSDRGAASHLRIPAHELTNAYMLSRAVAHSEINGRVRQDGVISGVVPGRHDQAALGVI